MPTVIDSLLVRLGLDGSDFEKGKAKVDKGLKDIGDNADSASKKVKKTSKDSADGFDKVAKAAAGFLALIGGTVAIKNFIQDTIESNAALQRFAKNLGESATTVAEWSNAAVVAGGTSDGLRGTLAMLSAEQTNLKVLGESGLLRYFSRLGISMTDIHGKAIPVTEELLNIGDALKKQFPNDRNTQYNFARQMGIDPGTINLILRSRAEAEKLLEFQKRWGGITDDGVLKEEHLNETMRETGIIFGGLGNKIVSDLTPALESFFNFLSNIGKWMSDHSGLVETFLGILAAGLVAVAVALIPINFAIVGVVAAFTALAAIISAVWEDFTVWKNGGDALIPWKKLEEAVRAVGEAAKWTWGLLTGAYNAVKEKISGAVDSTSGSNKKADATTTKQALSYFQSQGWTKEQAAGLAANLLRESSLNPNAVGDHGAAYGIGQWHADRQAEFKKIFGKDIRGSSLDEQLAFVQYELTKGNEKTAGDKLRSAKTAYESGSIVSRYYERPANSNTEATVRGGDAQGLVNASQFASGAGAANRAAAASSGAPAAGNNSVQTHIGQINVNAPNATDATGIAKDMAKSMDYLFTSQANYGLA